jgi:riboflavin biosynthesis pyrimidine reductase
VLLLQEGCPLDAVVDMLSQRGIQHIMVEGGPRVAQSFLTQKLVDRAIIIKAPVTFKEPVAGNIDSAALEAAGLQLLGTTEWDCDHIECWAKPGVEWPNGGVGNWP